MQEGGRGRPPFPYGQRRRQPSTPRRRAPNGRSARSPGTSKIAFVVIFYFTLSSVLVIMNKDDGNRKKQQKEGAMTQLRKDNLLRSKDVAHILDLPPDDVIYLARKGKLRAVKEGKYWKFRLRDVRVYQSRAQKQ
jgi:hypothetical protein